MKKELQPLKASFLTHLEAGQLITADLTEIDKLDKTKLTDPSLKAYLIMLGTKSAAFDKALIPIRKSDLTAKIEAADVLRGTALSAFGKAVDLFSTSEIAAEADAAASLKTVWNTYKNLAVMSYAAESTGIDNLVRDL